MDGLVGPKESTLVDVWYFCWDAQLSQSHHTCPTVVRTTVAGVILHA